MSISEIDAAASAFKADSSPSPEPAKGPARADNGRFLSTSEPIEHLFEGRDFEGEIDEPEEKPSGREKLPDGLNQEESDASQKDDERGEGEPDEPPDQDDGEPQEHYEVTVDGEVKQVSLKEALEGYIRTETFHQRMNKVSEAVGAVQHNMNEVGQMREALIKVRTDMIEEYEALLPKEPDWKAEFDRDPKAAYLLQEQYKAVKDKVAGMRSQKAELEKQQNEQKAAATKQFAEQEFTKFITNNKIPDKAALDKEIDSMRKTGLSAGFTEQEIAQVYDSRMLTVLRKASKYDRMMAAKPRAVIAGQGKTLTPGSGTVRGKPSVQTDRKGIDAAQRKLAASGSLDDAADFFLQINR